MPRNDGEGKTLKSRKGTVSGKKVYHAVGLGSNYWHEFTDAATPLEFSYQDGQESETFNGSDIRRSNDKITPPLIHVFPIVQTEDPPKRSKFKFSIKKLLQRKKKVKELTSDDTKLYSNGSEDNAGDSESLVENSSQSDIPFGVTDVPTQKIVAGMTHAAMIQKDGILMTGTLHGYTYHYPVVKPAPIPLRCTDIVCGARHVLAVFEGKVVMSWGSGYFGQLGHGLDIVYCHHPTIVERLSPAYVGGDIVSIFAGGLQSGAIICNAEDWRSRNKRKSISTRVFRWGSNRFEQLAIGTKANAVPYPTPMIDVLHPDTKKLVSFVQLDVGKVHTLGLDHDGQVYSWGCTANGRCGNTENNVSSSTSRSGYSAPKRVEALRKVVVKQVCAGDSHSLALSGSGRVFSWGNNSSGQLGMGHTTHLLSPRQIMDLEIVRKPSGNGNTSSDATEAPKDYQNGSKNDNDQSNASNKKTMAPSDRKSPPSSSSTTGASCGDESEERTYPAITSIYAAGSSSAALSSAGDLYTWGCDNANHLGLLIPDVSSIPNIEPCQRLSSSSRIQDSRSFDSRLNVLSPRRVDVLNQVGLKVESVAMSPNFIITICSEMDVNEILDEDSFMIGKSMDAVEK